jgi:imidazolonepropionase-like amidohydrolase
MPGMFDLHAHYAIELFGAGRKDETVAYPSLFLANGVTSTFPAGEMDPDAMRELRVRVENGVEPGPRLLNSGPYFGTARPGWNRSMTTQQIYAEVDRWAERGARGFKAKGITADELAALIERAHFHGLTVTGHLDSGNRNSVNPRDAILMGIDRIEHFMGGDAFTPDRSAYASYEHMTFDTPAFERIAELYKQHRTNFDATLSAYGYYGKRDPDVFTYFVDEKKFLTPYMRSVIDARPPRRVNEQFENIYWTKRKEIKAFYDAGGGDLITLGTDHPSWGEFFSPFSVHRELLALSRSGIPNAAVLRIATINSARAMGLGDRLGTIEVGKWADLVVVRGNPLEDIRRTRQPRVVIKAGRVYDPAALMRAVEGKIGPASAADTAAWAPTPRGGRGGTR